MPAKPTRVLSSGKFLDDSDASSDRKPGPIARSKSAGLSAGVKLATSNQLAAGVGQLVGMNHQHGRSLDHLGQIRSDKQLQYRTDGRYLIHRYPQSLGPARRRVEVPGRAARVRSPPSPMGRGGLSNRRAGRCGLSCLTRSTKIDAECRSQCAIIRGDGNSELSAALLFSVAPDRAPEPFLTASALGPRPASPACKERSNLKAEK